MIEMRTSERALFHRCPQRWFWSVVEGLAPHREATPLWFGTTVHIALAEWYQKGKARGPHPAETFERVLDSMDRSVRIPTGSEEWEKEYVDARDLGKEMLINYVLEYGRDSHKDYIVTEKTGYIWLPDLAGNPKQIKYWYTFDGVYRDEQTGEIWLDEHKTAASISTLHLPLDRQAGSYWAVAEGKLRRAGLIKPGEHVQGIMFNFLRKARKDLRPRNARGEYCNKPKKDHYHAAFAEAGLPIELYQKMNIDYLVRLAYKEGIKVLGDVSAHQPNPLFERYPVYRTIAERQSQFKSIKEDAYHIDRARNDPNYPIMKNVQSVGATACPQCPFFRMCELHEQGDMESVREFKKAMYVVRDPYAAYRKSA
jgi:hypothetical protein